MEAKNNSRSKDADARDGNKGADKFSGWTADEQVECLLGQISESGSVSDLKSLVKANPCVFEDMAVRGVNTPLHVAASRGHLDLIREIMDLRPGFAERMNLDGLTPVHLAVERGHVEIVKELLSRNPELHRARDCHGRTPLHYGAARGKDRVVEALVELSSLDDGMEEVTHRGETPLHLAAKNKHKAVFQILMGRLDAGGEPRGKRIMSELTDKAGNTVVQLAHSNNMLTPTQSLRYGANVGWNGGRWYKFRLYKLLLFASVVSSMLADGPLYSLSLAAVSSKLAKAAVYFLTLCVSSCFYFLFVKFDYSSAGQCRCDTTPRERSHHWDTTGCMQHMDIRCLVMASFKELLSKTITII